MTLYWSGSSAYFQRSSKKPYIALDVLVAVTVTEQVVKVSSPPARYVNDKWMGQTKRANMPAPVWAFEKHLDVSVFQRRIRRLLKADDASDRSAGE